MKVDVKAKRTPLDKLRTLLFGKDLRITEGDAFKEEYEFDYSSYLPIDKYISPQELPGGKAYYITDFGAVANDKSIDNAPAINKCIDACAENGGGYVVVSGGDFTTKTVELKSNITLFVESSSSLVAEESGSGYKKPALIYAKDCENISITGGGTINGNGHLFGRKPLYDENVTSAPEVIDVIEMRRISRAQLRFAHPSKYGRLVLLEDCESIKINNIILYDSAYWTLKLTRCNNVSIENLVINDNRHVANTDGIDMLQTSNVEIKHCFISCADDGICLKNAVWEHCDGEMKNIHISDCEVITRANAFKIGTETTHDISNVTVENCKFYMTDLYPETVSGISIESADGARVYNITARNIEMNRCSCAIFIRLCNRNRAAEVDANSASAIEFGKKVKGKGVNKSLYDMKGEVHDIVIENINAKNVEIPVILAGFKQKGKTKRVKNITLKNINLEYRNAKEVVDRRLFIPEYVKVYPECTRFRNLPAYGIWARHAENLKIENFNCTPAPNHWRKKYIFKDII
jgi:polygalacturonase